MAKQPENTCTWVRVPGCRTNFRGAGGSGRLRNCRQAPPPPGHGELGDNSEMTEPSGYVPEELRDLKKLLADQYVGNFSVFQSLLDHWGLDQLFPVAPLHRLNEKPTVNAVLVDITCDSDGKIDRFIDLQDVKDYITLHPLNNKPYYLGIFLTGAYQDIMGDLHNLFGRVNEVHVFLENDEPNDFYIEEALAGSRVSDVIEGVQYQWEELCRRMKQQIDHATKKDLVKPREGVRLLEFYESQMSAKTYLNIERGGGRKPKA